MTDEQAEPVVVQPEIVEGAEAVDQAGEPSEGGGGVPSVESPGKIIRIGSMVKQLLDEVRNTPMDDAARDHLREIYEISVIELRGALSPDLSAELDRLAPDFDDDTIPTDAQLRIAQAQLVGWLEGLFHGIQATLMAQQMVAQQQLAGMRNQLGPGGPVERGGPGGGPFGGGVPDGPEAASSASAPGYI